MRVQAIDADITTLKVDAIVNAANSAMIIGGGVDGAIHKAAGKGLIIYNAQHHGFGCPTGQVKITPGFNLPAKFIMHTVGPDMRLYRQDIGDLLLESCYANCMKLAIEEGLKSIAFPAISTGIFGFDKKRAAKIAAKTVLDFRGEGNDMDVTFACFGTEDAVIVNEAIEAIDAEEHCLSWSVGSTYYDDENDDEVLDLDTDAPDGVYSVIHNWCGNSLGKSHGVTVMNGKFVPEPTLRACAEARNDAGYWGTFLEELEYRIGDDGPFFEAHFGS